MGVIEIFAASLAAVLGQALIEEGLGKERALGLRYTSAAKSVRPLRTDSGSNGLEYLRGIHLAQQEAPMAGEQIESGSGAAVQAALKRQAALLSDHRKWRQVIGRT